VPPSPPERDSRPRSHGKHMFAILPVVADKAGDGAGTSGFFGETSVATYRRIMAESFYESERLMDAERDFWGESPVVYDPEHDVYRFRDDDVFAFGPATINERELIRRGLWEEPSSEQVARTSRRA
jgi:hypothetical protein